ncbi:MAG: hypothetical protein K2O29_08140 [Ruminococcus sp.]|nr:hypothetical protein [Ruminococcus sp.]MDE6848333.1 hypothetical protein [Ruminococcus sp.]MDE7138408.1 hypothetical protein [Ruminococcus sp.]
MDYEFECILDNRSGGTDFNNLAQVLRKRSAKGWKLVNTFTNEVGINSTSVTIGNYTGGTNATIDQVVMIFEHPISMTDAKAQQIIKKLQENS